MVGLGAPIVDFNTHTHTGALSVGLKKRAPGRGLEPGTRWLADAQVEKQVYCFDCMRETFVSMNLNCLSGGLLFWPLASSTPAHR